MSRTVIALVLVATFGARVARADDDEVPLYECKAPSPQTKISVTFKPDIPLHDLIAWAIGFTCKNFVVASDVDKYVKMVTIIAPAKMSPKQAMQLFVDAVEATGLVVVQKPDTIIIKLGPTMPKNCPVVATSPTKVPIARDPLAPRDNPPPDPDLTEADLDAAIKVVDATHREIKSALLDRILQNPMTVAKGARVVPAQKNGQPVGFKLYAIKKDSLFWKLGFENGDAMLSINGMPLTSADKALEVYTKIRDAKVVTVQIERTGKPLTLTFTIK